MKGGFHLILIVALILAFFSCSSEGEADYYAKANELMSQEKWEEAEKNFQKILDDYPEGEYRAKAMFMVGFINANYTNNFDKAREYYNDFLKKYPDHDLADDAEYEINNLGKSIDDLPFLKGQEAESADVAKGEESIQSSQ